jgi:LCP family protein required for cell wall assembly
MPLKQFKRRLVKYSPFVKPTILLVVLFVVILLLIKALSPLFTFARQNNISLKLVFSLLTSKDVPLKKYQDRTNVVILGIAGSSHDGPDLTDTIIFLSFDFTKHDVVLVSIPRDIWLPSIRDKINSAYHYGEKKKEGGGIIMAKAAVEEVVGQPIHYAWVVDFSGFKKLIDLVGGVDIVVERGFVDEHYPIPGREDDTCGGDPKFACRYETLRFEKGLQHMDGERALKYVRSRQAEGDQGTDFARDSRQQQVIVALKNKLFDLSFLKQLDKTKQLLSTLSEYSTSDMDLSEKILFSKFFLQLKNQNIRKIVLDSGDENKKRAGFLVNPPLEEQYKNLWVLAPRTGNFDEIKEYVACQLKDPACSLKP